MSNGGGTAARRQQAQCGQRQLRDLIVAARCPTWLNGGCPRRARNDATASIEPVVYPRPAGDHRHRTEATVAKFTVLARIETTAVREFEHRQIGLLRGK